jgi:serine/threonine protein kinase
VCVASSYKVLSSCCKINNIVSNTNIVSERAVLDIFFCIAHFLIQLIMNTAVVDAKRNSNGSLWSLSSNPNNNCKQIKIGNYLLGATIGKGNSAVVKLATHVITQQKVAIKMFDKCSLDEEKQLRLRREIDSMKLLKHKSIIRLYEIMETSKLICLVTEYAINGELYHYILRKNRLSEREARYIFKQIVDAINYCHLNKIVHRDVKVENLLMDSNRQVKLADFGFSSKFSSDELLDVYCGSPPYCAPELYLAKLYDGPKVDVWSLGVVLYVLVCGCLPFEARTFDLLRSQVICGSYKVPFFLSEDCISLLSGMLTVDTIKRSSINDIMNHKWVLLDNDADLLNSYSRESHFTENFMSENDDHAITKKITHPDINILKEIEKYNLNIEEISKSVGNNEFDSNAGLYYLTEAKFSALANNNYEQNKLNSADFPSYKHKSSSRNNHHYKSLFYKDPNFAKPNKLSALNDQINQKLDLTISHRKKIFSSLKKDNETSKTDNLPSSHHFNHHHNNKNNNKRKINDAAIIFDEDEIKDDIQLVSRSEEEEEEEAEEDEVVTTTGDEDEEDDEMPMEELGRNYLSRNSNIRRHTIGTDSENENLNQNLPTTTNPNFLAFRLLYNNNKSILNGEQKIKHASSNNYILEPNLSAPSIAANSQIMSTPKKVQYSLKSNSNSNSHNLYEYHHSKHHKQHHLNHHNLKPQRKNRYSQLLSVPANNTRRASDGGSNISLFNHIYYNKLNSNSTYDNNPTNDNNNNNTNSTEASNMLENEDSCSIEFDGLNIYNTAEDVSSSCNLNKNCNEDDENEIENDVSFQAYRSSFKQRGSITSGIPIFSVTSTSGGTIPLNTKKLGGPAAGVRAGSHSSEDEDLNAYSGGSGSNCSMKYQRKSSKSRHEPYMDNLSVCVSGSGGGVGGSINLNLSGSSSPGNANGSCISKTSPTFHTRQREQSLSGKSNQERAIRTNSYSGGIIIHRGSEPSSFDLINANRSHLERIYFQSINKASLPINEELKILQQENRASYEQQQHKWKTQHLMQNFSKLCCGKETMDVNESHKDSSSPGLTHPFTSPRNNFNFSNNVLNAENQSIGFNYINGCNTNNNGDCSGGNNGDVGYSVAPKFSAFDSTSDREKPTITSTLITSTTPNNNNTDYNSENTVNECLKNLHMIHEQNETTAMHSSTSSSICSSSESTTPRLNRSYVMLDRRTSLEYDHEEQSRIMLKNAHKLNNSSKTNYMLKRSNYPQITTPIMDQYYSMGQSTLNNYSANNITKDDTTGLFYRNNIVIGNNDHLHAAENNNFNFSAQNANLTRISGNSIINFTNENEPEAALK